MTTQYTSVIFDFDSTLVSLESLDELIRMSLEDRSNNERTRIMQEIEDITNAGMNGEMELRESIRRRLRAAAPHRSALERFAARVTDAITPEMPQLVAELLGRQKDVYVISGGLKDCILPVSRLLMIPDAHVLANTPVFEHDRIVDVEEFPLAYSDGKGRLISTLRTEGAMKGPVWMVGDGISDLLPYKQRHAEEFCGFAMHADRQKVREGAPRVCGTTGELRTYLLGS